MRRCLEWKGCQEIRGKIWRIFTYSLVALSATAGEQEQTPPSTDRSEAPTWSSQWTNLNLDQIHKAGVIGCENQVGQNCIPFEKGIMYSIGHGFIFISVLCWHIPNNDPGTSGVSKAIPF
jgi:hypothetical protein